MEKIKRCGKLFQRSKYLSNGVPETLALESEDEKSNFKKMIIFSGWRNSQMERSHQVSKQDEWDKHTGIYIDI